MWCCYSFLQGAQLHEQVPSGGLEILRAAWCRVARVEASAVETRCGRLGERGTSSTTSSHVNLVEYCTKAARGLNWLRLWACSLHGPVDPDAMADTPRAPVSKGTFPSHLPQCRPAWHGNSQETWAASPDPTAGGLMQVQGGQGLLDDCNGRFSPEIDTLPEGSCCPAGTAFAQVSKGQP